MTEASYMEQALAEAAHAADRGEVPVGAVLVDAGTGAIIAAAGNGTEELNDPTAHAEVLVIREAAGRLGTPRLPECDLYVTLEPCPLCATAISFARIRRLYFGAYDPKGGGVDHGPRIFEQAICRHKPEIYGGIDERSCGALLKRFFQGKRFFLPFVLAFALAAFPVRADFQAGMAAYGGGDYATALKEWKPAAEQGDVFAQHMMGFLYAKGRGVKRDLGQAVSWWTRAAESGHPPAQFVLGKVYLKGIGVERDVEVGARWIERAAEAGFVEAQIFYGALYAKGEGVSRDLVQAYMWLDLAASGKGREPGAFWDTITPYQTPKEVRAANKQINKWNSGKD